MTSLHVVYTWTAFDGTVLRVGRTSWRRWSGWRRCAGRCHARRRAEHRFCEEYLTLRKWAPLRAEVAWEEGPVHSRIPEPGCVTWRLVLGDARTARVERATIEALRPTLNVQHGPARPRLRSVP